MRKKFSSGRWWKVVLRSAVLHLCTGFVNIADYILTTTGLPITYDNKMVTIKIFNDEKKGEGNV